MNARELIRELNTGEFKIEHTVIELDGKSIITGFIQDKNDDTGFGRREFAFESATEQDLFIEGYSAYIKSIMS